MQLTRLARLAGRARVIATSPRGFAPLAALQRLLDCKKDRCETLPPANPTPQVAGERLNLRAALTAASCGLLGITQTAVGDSSDPNQADNALLYYAEKHRVQVGEGSAIVTVPLGTDENVSLDATVDVISGASPNGATATDKDQTFGSHVTPAGELPLQSFNDQRLGVGAAWQYPVDRLSRAVLGANFSTEQDYTSIGANYAHMWDSANKLTTWTASLSGSFDTVEPSSGIIPDGLTPLGSSAPSSTAPPPSVGEDTGESTIDRALVHAVSSASGGSSSGGSGGSGGGDAVQYKTKQVVDALFGVTQVLNRRTLMQFNYGIGTSHGYLTDPYKIISSIDGETGETLGYLTEKRPDSRLRQTLYWQTVLHLPSDVIHLSYRHYWDDWGIRAETVDLHYRFNFGRSGYYLEPQARYYTQSASAFYRFSLVDGANLPRYASADYRLADMTSITYGLKFAMPLSNDGEVSIRAMSMQQTGDSHPADAIGVQRSQDLYPGLEAYAVQLGLSFKF